MRWLVLAAFVMVALPAVRANAQSPAPASLRFEVASVKPSMSPADLALLSMLSLLPGSEGHER